MSEGNLRQILGVIIGIIVIFGIGAFILIMMLILFLAVLFII